METKIELGAPYCNDFVAAYLNINSEPRRVVLLVRKDKSKTSTSYARYLMSCNLGRYLDKSEHVDHIDNNKLNDIIENLQILTPKENNIKRNRYHNISRSFHTLMCPVCKTEFVREARNVNHKITKGKTLTCSRSCGAKWGNSRKNKKV